MKPRLQFFLSIPLLLFITYLLVMTPLMGRKKGYTVDATPSFHLTKAIVQTGAFFPPVPVKQGYIYSIVYIPFYGLGSVAANIFSLVPVEWVQRKCMCWMNTVITALQLCVLALILKNLRFSKLAQAAIPLLYGFSTIAFAYARYDYNKCLAGLLILCALWSLLRDRHNQEFFWALLCGVFVGVLLTLRAELGIIAIPCLIGIVWGGIYQGRWLKSTIAFALPVILGGLFFSLYNWMYWEGRIAGGYEEGFVLNPLPALAGFLFSPGKSLFYFNPVLILLPLIVRRFYAHNHFDFFVWGSVLLLPFLLYCFWGNWWGGWGWGPRHLVPLIPLMVIPLAWIVDHGSRVGKILLCALAVLGLLVQWAGTCVDFSDVLLMLKNADVWEQDTLWEQETIWTPVYSPLFHHFRVLISIPLQRWDYGWITLSQQLNPTYYYLMFISWLIACGVCLSSLFHAALKANKYNAEK